MQRPRAYFVIASFLAAYIAVYSIFESIHERQLSRVSSERNVFMTMVSSGKSGSFIATMQTFGPLQNRAVSF